MNDPRPRATNERRETVGNLIELVGLVHQPEVLVDQIAKDRRDAAREAQGIGAILHVIVRPTADSAR